MNQIQTQVKPSTFIIGAALSNSERTCLNLKEFDPAEQPLFLGEDRGVQRYDRIRYEFLSTFVDNQLAQFWRPSEISLTQDAVDFKTLTNAEKHILLSNLRYQTVMDTVQGREPLVFLKNSSSNELESAVIFWTAFENIHSMSYTHIVQSCVPDISATFDTINTDKAIIERAVDISKHYDEFEKLNDYLHRKEDLEKDFGIKIEIDMHHYRGLLLICLFNVLVLEAVRFFVSFACTFSFCEQGKLKGIGNIMQFIMRDEFLHFGMNNQLLHTLITDPEDPEWGRAWESVRDKCWDILMATMEQEFRWADYLMKDGPMLGLNANILKNAAKYYCNLRMGMISGYAGGRFSEVIYPEIKANPVPFMENYVRGRSSQTAAQELEITSYRIGEIKTPVQSEAVKNYFERINQNEKK